MLTATVNLLMRCTTFNRLSVNVQALHLHTAAHFFDPRFHVRRACALKDAIDDGVLRFDFPV